MGLLSTEAVIFSFEGGLSTDLNGSYSQGLIHRKPSRWIAAVSTGKPPSRAISLKKRGKTGFALDSRGFEGKPGCKGGVTYRCRSWKRSAPAGHRS
ncbi:hypothetical protein B1219_07260 [Pseudomonas ogarae]|nr:hypothetical protein B1219_07260 [Pseudomonas ogarae]OPG81252.1 hypothetical protein B1218_00790 [Pseudomonas ogarae]